MENLEQKKWITGSGNDVSFLKAIKLVKEYVDRGSKIFIGSDSFVWKENLLCNHTLSSRWRIWWKILFLQRKSSKKYLQPTYIKNNGRNKTIGRISRDFNGRARV